MTNETSLEMSLIHENPTTNLLEAECVLRVWLMSHQLHDVHSTGQYHAHFKPISSTLFLFPGPRTPLPLPLGTFADFLSRRITTAGVIKEAIQSHVRRSQHTTFNHNNFRRACEVVVCWQRRPQ